MPASWVSDTTKVTKLYVKVRATHILVKYQLAFYPFVLGFKKNIYSSFVVKVENQARYLFPSSLPSSGVSVKHVSDLSGSY